MTEQYQCAEHYTVKRGDSFYLIAHRLNVPLRDLLAANESIPPSRLTIGDVLCIPEIEDANRPAQEQKPGTGNGGNTSPGDQTGSKPESKPETKPESKPENGETQKPEAGGQKPETDAEKPEEKPETGEEKPEEKPETDEEGEEEKELCPPNRRTVIQQNQTASDLQIKYDLSYYTLQKANEETDLDGLKAGDVVCVPAFNVPCPLPETVTLKAGDTLESTALAYNLPISSLLRANPCLSPADFIEGAQIKLPK